jgi:hypothetical protein
MGRKFLKHFKPLVSLMAILASAFLTLGTGMRAARAWGQDRVTVPVRIILKFPPLMPPFIWATPLRPRQHARWLLTTVELLILDDFALQPLSATETSDFYELCVERQQRASTVVTSNRAPVNGSR